METVAFYSYKGGVGRTLLVANTAQLLALSGRRVVALDLDLEAPGLHHKLASRDALGRATRGELRGTIDELLDALENEPRNRSLRETAIEVHLPTGASGSLLLIAAGSAPSHAYWAALERLNSSLRAHRRNGGLLEAVLELQARIADEFAPDFLLIDSRTGITELGGLATSILADRVVCLTTTAPESVEGTQVVAEALRTAPRLASQQPLRIDFLITRVPFGSAGSSSVSRVIQELGGSAAVLPHDSGIALEERVLSSLRSRKSAPSEDGEDAGQELFSATLSWIVESFPVHKQDAERARRRMQVVHRAWQDLTRTTERLRGGTGTRAAWPPDQLRERVRFGSDKDSRQADIVAYDGPPEASTTKPLMIIEYVEDEDRDTVARWWLAEARVQVVAVLSGNSFDPRPVWDSRGRHSGRWDLPLPHDFIALSDPTDVSIEALLDAVRRGYPEYLERTVTEWMHCSAAGLYGGAPWKLQHAKSIVDGLAGIDDVELARQVLLAASADPRRLGISLGDGEDWLDEQVVAELFAPLLWRLPPEASIELMHGYQRPFGPSFGTAAITLLARDVLGLRYDPDATFRLEGQRILERSRRDTKTFALYELCPAFKHTEISFEVSSDLPPLAASQATQEEEQRKPPDLGAFVSERIAAGSLVTTGLLGDYQPQLGRVVLYNTAISHCADKLALQARHVGSVTLIHETLHALAHLGRDLDGRMWPEFALPAANTPLFEPSWFHETLTQYFTYQQIVRLRDPALLLAFETMSAKQTPAYRAWRRLRNLPIEDARSWFMSVRRGVGVAAPSSQVLFDAMRDES